MLISHPAKPQIVVAVAIVSALQAKMDEEIIRIHHLETTEVGDVVEVVHPPPIALVLFAKFATKRVMWHWIVITDSGAAHHLTLQLANLNVKAEEYSGSDTIRVGNGSSYGEVAAPRPK
ncbi:uncharacterized protein LOC122318086 [Carya illinoinensis]|uniref:uncharacterized protein LOC122318086 n=1 Tax=Carya illinoinensis TaxID=32201 RepID=UPI001C71D521|nr:uncharacterized protein LOC122318086 [Carya illinoinensis]